MSRPTDRRIDRLLQLLVTNATVLVPGPKIASDPEVNKRLLSNPRSLEAFMALPLPGAEQAFFVDTLSRVDRIAAPTLVLWGEDDKLDPPETARMIHDALTCKKRLEIVPGNGHVGHLDRNRERVFDLTADWVLENLACERNACQLCPSGA